MHSTRYTVTQPALRTKVATKLFFARVVYEKKRPKARKRDILRASVSEIGDLDQINARISRNRALELALSNHSNTGLG